MGRQRGAYGNKGYMNNMMGMTPQQVGEARIRAAQTLPPLLNSSSSSSSSSPSCSSSHRLFLYPLSSPFVP